MAKAKKKKWKYKYLRPEQVDELMNEKTEDLLLKAHKQQTAINVLEKQKKDDEQLKQLRADIKLHKDNHENRAKIKELNEEKKLLESEINEEIEDTILDKKALEGGHKDSINSSKEMLKAITSILSRRV